MKALDPLVGVEVAAADDVPVKPRRARDRPQVPAVVVLDQEQTPSIPHHNQNLSDRRHPRNHKKAHELQQEHHPRVVAVVRPTLGRRLMFLRIDEHLILHPSKTTNDECEKLRWTKSLTSSKRNLAYSADSEVIKYNNKQLQSRTQDTTQMARAYISCGCGACHVTSSFSSNFSSSA